MQRVAVDISVSTNRGRALEIGRREGDRRQNVRRSYNAEMSLNANPAALTCKFYE
jgi:hypothetical protein